MNTPQRLFFALWPDEAQRAAIQSLSREALAASGGRAIPAGNLHATLLFLGNVPGESLSLLESAAQALRGQACELQLDRIDTWRRAATLVLEASAVPPGLTELVSHLRQAVEKAGFSIESRLFRFHVTLARKTTIDQRLELRAPLIWWVRDFVLVRSQLRPEGSEYTVLRRWELREVAGG